MYYTWYDTPYERVKYVAGTKFRITAFWFHTKIINNYKQWTMVYYVDNITLLY